MFDQLPASFTVVLPLFSLVALGVLIQKTGWITPPREISIRWVVYKIGLPILVFDAMSRSKLPDSLNLGYYIGHFTGVYVSLLVTAVLTWRLFARRHPDPIVLGFSGAQANIGLVGIALANLALGGPAGAPIALLLAVNLPVNLILASVLVQSHDSDQGLRLLPLLKTALKAFFRALCDPIILSILSATVLNLYDVSVPAPVAQILNLASWPVIPLSLMSVGLAVGRIGFSVNSEVLLITFNKLLLHPMVAFFMGKYIFGLEPLWLQVAIIFAAAPTGVNALPFADRHGTVYPEVCAVFTFTTLLSVPSYMIWFWVVGI